MTSSPKKYAEKGFASIKETCEFLGIGKSSVYELMRKGTLPFVFMGTRRFIPRIALEEFAEKIIESGRIELSS